MPITNASDFVIFDIEEELKKTADIIDNFNKENKTETIKSYPNGGSTTFYTYDKFQQPLGAFKLHFGKDGKISEGDKINFLKATREQFEKEDFNGDHKISESEMDMLFEPGAAGFAELAKTLQTRLKDGGASQTQLDEMNDLVKKAARDGKLSRAEDSAIKDLYESLRIQLKDTGNIPLAPLSGGTPPVKDKSPTP